MYHLHKGTLEYHKQRPLFNLRDVSDIAVSTTIGRLNAFMTQHKDLVSVEESALKFYMLNHAYALILQKFDPQEVMPNGHQIIVDMYINEASKITQRLMYYVLLIITRESRHVYKHKTSYQDLMKPYEDALFQWHNSIPSSSVYAAEYLRTNPAPVSLGKYVSAMTDIFFKGDFSGGYGGKPWGNIADTIRKLVHAEISPEMFTDTAWTLAHNNGPMFNKGMLYNLYTGDIYKILDVQRSGQIPQLVLEGKVNGITASVKELFELCRKAFPEEFSGYVDWYQVEDLGALKSYPTEKKNQLAKYGHSPVAEAKHQEEKSKFYVSNEDFVYISQRKKAA